MKVEYPTNLRVSLTHKEIYVLPFHERLKKDPELQHAFQCNIAMAFIDRAHWYKKEKGCTYLSREDILNIANEAAQNFINIWTGA